MPRQYATHARRIRVNIDLNYAPPPVKVEKPKKVSTGLDDWDVDELFEDVGPRKPDAYELFEALSFTRDGMTYYPPKKDQQKGEGYLSRTRGVSLKGKKKKAQGALLTWSSEYGLTITIDSPKPEPLIKRVCEDVKAILRERGFDADPHPVNVVVQREEIATWIRDEDLEAVLSRLPWLARYAECLGWTVGYDEGEEGSRIIFHGLALNFPRLYPVGDARHDRHVALDVKLYKTASRNQRYKLEFQMEIPRQKGRKLLPEERWNDTIRATGLKLMDAFMEFVGVEDTTIAANQADNVTPLTRIPYEPDMLAALKNIERRPEVSGANFFIQDMKLRLGLDEDNRSDRAVVGLLRSFKHVEVAWGKFHREFEVILDALSGDDGAEKDKARNMVEALQPTRKNLGHRVGRDQVKTTSSQYLTTLKKRLIDGLGIVEERKYSNRPALLRFKGQVFEQDGQQQGKGSARAVRI